MDMIDFDVNNLFVMRGYTNALGMRVSLAGLEEEGSKVLQKKLFVFSIF